MGDKEQGQEDLQASASSLGADADAAFDAAFESADLDTDDDGSDNQPVEKPARAKAKPEPKEEADEDEPEVEEEGGDEELAASADDDEDDEQEAGDDDGAAEEDDADEDSEDLAIHRAWTLLHESGVPAKVIKNTPKAELIAWAERVESRAEQARADAADAKSQEQTTSKGAKASDDSAASQKPQDWAALRQAISEKLGVDVESADSLKPLFDAHEATRAEVKEMRARFESAESAAREREGRALIDTHTRRLSETYPKLRESSKARERLVAEAKVQIAGMRAGGAKDIDATKVFDKAALLAFGPPKRSDLSKLRRNGAATHPGQKGGGLRAPAQTEDEYYARALDHVDAGRPDLARNLRPPERKGRRGA